jgi:putative ABC transport system permease protein
VIDSSIGTKMIDIFSSAWATVTRHRLCSVLAILGVAIGVCALTSIMSTENSWRKAVIAFFAPMDLETVKVALSTDDNWQGSGFRRGSLEMSDVEAIQARCPAIQSITPMMSGSVEAKTRGSPVPTNLYAVPAGFTKTLPDKVCEGRLFTREEEARKTPVCLLSFEARVWLFGDEPAVGQPIRLQGRRFTVVGVISGNRRVGISAQAVYIPFDQARRLVTYGSFYRPRMQIFARTRDPRTTSQEIERLMRERVGGEKSYQFTESLWVVREQAVHARMRVTLYSGLAGFCALLAAGIGIAALLFVSVAERSQEIGIRRAVGASRGVVCGEYIITAAILALLGALLGGVLAVPASAMGVFATKWQPVTGTSGAVLGGGRQLPSMSDIAVSVSWGALGIAVILALVIGIVAALAPASEAAGVDPARAIARRAGTEIRPRRSLTSVQVGFGVLVLIILTSYFSVMQNQERTEARNALGQDSISATVDPIAAMRKPLDDRYVQKCREIIAGVITSPEKMDNLRRNTPLLGAVTPSVRCVAAVSSGGRTMNQAWLTFTTAEAFEYEPALPADIKAKVTEAFRAGQAVAVIAPWTKTVFFGRHDAIGKTITVAGRKFTVVAVHDCPDYRGEHWDPNVVPGIVIPTEFYAAIEHRINRIENLSFSMNETGVYARPLDSRQYDKAAAQFRDALLHTIPEEYRLTIKFREEIPETTRQFIFQHKAVAARGAVGALAVLLVALIGLANMLLVSIYESLRETGLRRALGAQKSDVFLHFMSEGVWLSAIGAGAGLALGAGICFAARTWAGLPITLSAFWTVAGAVATVIAGLAVSLPPAVIAARVRPVEALRYE